MYFTQSTIKCVFNSHNKYINFKQKASDDELINLTKLSGAVKLLTKLYTRNKTSSDYRIRTIRKVSVTMAIKRQQSRTHLFLVLIVVIFNVVIIK